MAYAPRALPPARVQAFVDAVQGLAGLTDARELMTLLVV